MSSRFGDGGLWLTGIALLGMWTTVLGQIDSGGERTSLGGLINHPSIGSAYETARVMTSNYAIYPGLIPVLYPPLPPIDPNLDSDFNGFPDQWEMDNFNHLGVVAEEDADHDGTTNEMEFLAGTDPNDPASVFRPAVHRDGDSLVLPVPTVSGRTYKVWGSPDMDAWEALDIVPGDGTVIEFSYLLSDPDSLPYFLKLEITIP